MAPDTSGIGFTVAAAPPSIPSQDYCVLTIDEFLATEFPPREIILAPWLPSKGLAMIYGPRGVGKTHLTLGCAYAIASGGTFLGWKAPEPRRVIVIDGEMPAVALQERLSGIAKAAQAMPPAPEYLSFLPLDLQKRAFDLGNVADQIAIEPFLEGVSVVIIDNLSTLARTGRENEAESWLPIQEWALEQRRKERTVVFIHHAGKGGGQRGTSRREDVLDTVIAIRKPEDYQADQGARFEVHYEKNRGFHGDDAKPFEASLGASGWLIREVLNADMMQVTALAAEGLSTREIEKKTGISKSRVGRLLHKKDDEGSKGTRGRG
jgi:putative DNA primase/helicase